jgi:hypothetical protein
VTVKQIKKKVKKGKDKGKTVTKEVIIRFALRTSALDRFVLRGEHTVSLL